MAQRTALSILKGDILEQRTALPIAPEAGPLDTSKQPYTPPRAICVPLRLEERLIASSPLPLEVCQNCIVG